MTDSARDFLKANEKILGSSTIVAALSEGCIAPFLYGLSVHEVAQFIKLRERYEKEVVAYANLNSRNVNKDRTSWKPKVDFPLWSAGLTLCLNNLGLKLAKKCSKKSCTRSVTVLLIREPT